MRKILLNKRRGKESVNNINSIPVEINRDATLYHDEIKSTTVDIMQIYNEEKNSSTKHRFIFTISPVCTNALFNRITEVVYKEGSKECKMLTNDDVISRTDITPTPISTTSTINRLQVIRNTEYSNDSNLTYHCGVDIFNNHLLRSKEDISIQKRNGEQIKEYEVFLNNNGEGKIYDAFNTIADYNRNSNGETLKSKIPVSGTSYTYNNETREKYTPIYTHDNIHSLTESYNNNISRKNGWWGFTNPSTFVIPVSGTSYFINKLFNNKEACQYIDMCPERDLLSFTPKKNPYRKRLEYNWDYCLTYPFKSEDNISFLSGKTGLPIIKLTTGDTISNNGVNIEVFQCPVKHNLRIGDYVNLKCVDSDKIYTAKCEVIKLGDLQGKYEDRCFKVLKSDYMDILPSGTSIEYFTKIVSGFECEYYFRKFKKIKDDLRSNLSRLAFAGTIYGDEVSQLVFTDDVNIEGLKDNRGRPLTDIYLTLIKRNSGYKEWYNLNDNGNNDITGETIEYSHVFGEVTSGLDLPDYVGIDYPSVRKQHNINGGKIFTATTENSEIIKIEESSKKIEFDITIKEDEFYGDLVEFCPTTLEETVLEDVYHRVNTAQREVTKSTYNTIYSDEIRSDIYAANSGNINKIRCREINKGFANLDPEGYMYKPHYKIKINSFEPLIYQESDILMKDVKKNFTTDTLSITADTNYYLQTGDIIDVFNKMDKTLKQYIVDTHKIDSNKFITECSLKEGIEGFDNSHNVDLFVHNLNIPDYAYMLKDGTGRHLWRNILKPSEREVTDELYNIPFTNNAFYHHTNITFFFKRQDPFGNYKMHLKDENGFKYENNFAIPSKELETSKDEYITENKTSCF